MAAPTTDAASSDAPLLVVAHDDPNERARVGAELERRYSCDYGVVGVPRGGAAEALATLGEASDVALLLAQHGADDEQLLGLTRERFPTAKRAMLVPWLGWADPELAAAIRTAAGRGWIDLYVLEPGAMPDEVFHRTVSELLQERARLRGSGPAGAVVRGPSRSRRVRELDSTLAALGIPHRVVTTAESEQPTVVLAGHEPLVDPRPEDVAAAVGFHTGAVGGEADAVVVGAGPAGLGAAVYAASEGLRTVVVDRRGIGGQLRQRLRGPGARHAENAVVAAVAALELGADARALVRVVVRDDEERCVASRREVRGRRPQTPAPRQNIDPMICEKRITVTVSSSDTSRL